MRFLSLPLLHFLQPTLEWSQAELDGEILIEASWRWVSSSWISHRWHPWIDGMIEMTGIHGSMGPVPWLSWNARSHLSRRSLGPAFFFWFCQGGRFGRSHIFMQNLLIANFWGVLQATPGEFLFIFGILGEGWVILWSLSQRLASLWLDWFDDIPSFVATCFFCFDVAVVRTVRGFYNSWTVLLISLTGRKRRPLIQQLWLLIGCAYTTWCWIRNLPYHTYRSGVIYSGSLLRWELFDHFVSLGVLALPFWNLEGMNRKESSHSRKSQTDKILMVHWFDGRSFLCGWEHEL